MSTVTLQNIYGNKLFTYQEQNLSFSFSYCPFRAISRLPLHLVMFIVALQNIYGNKLFTYQDHNLSFSFSGAPAAQRAAKRSPIIIEKGTTCMHKNRNPYTLFTNGRQPGTSARPNMESRRFGIKICFRANFDQVTGQLTLKLSVI